MCGGPGTFIGPLWLPWFTHWTVSQQDKHPPCLWWTMSLETNSSSQCGRRSKQADQSRFQELQAFCPPPLMEISPEKFYPSVYVFYLLDIFHPVFLTGSSEVWTLVLLTISSSLLDVDSICLYRCGGGTRLVAAVVVSRWLGMMATVLSLTGGLLRRSPGGDNSGRADGRRRRAVHT